MITVSLVSHGHGKMVWRLVEKLITYREVTKIIITLNTSEDIPEILSDKVVLLKNQIAKGFGENHNRAFNLSNNNFYCVINPDIKLSSNPFIELLNVLKDQNIGLVAPLVVNSRGIPEDSMRRTLTPWSMLKRIFGLNSDAYNLLNKDLYIMPDWIAGMFMLFRSETYLNVGGFDERYFMYCEDVDICDRIWRSGYKVLGCLSVVVTHNAQRASHRDIKHFIWHVRSLLRYFSRKYSIVTL